MARVGDPGIVTMYAAKEAPAALRRAQREHGDGMGRDSDLPGPARQLDAAVRDFEGAAGVVRFKDGAVEAEFSTKGLGTDIVAGSPSGPRVADLPGTTAAALSVAFEEGWLDSYLDSVGSGRSLDEELAQAERFTGLELPEDIETLLGDGLTVSLDSRADLAALRGSGDLTELPAGIRIKGDADRITAIIDKLKAAAGGEVDTVQVRSRDGIVAVGTDPAYLESLLEKGDLGDTEALASVLPEADGANSVLFVDFDAGDGWAERLADQLSEGDPEVSANVAPLDAFGVTSRQDGDGVQHGLLRLTTD
jgi:hypothetical protein